MASGDSQSERQPPHQSDAVDASVLDEIIRKTMAKTQLGGLSHEELRALFSVAMRHRAAPLELEPVVVELVDSILQLRFRTVLTDEAGRQQVAHQIGNSLMESPESEQRLQSFWSKLVEAAK